METKSADWHFQTSVSDITRHKKIKPIFFCSVLFVPPSATHSHPFYRNYVLTNSRHVFFHTIHLEYYYFTRHKGNAEAQSFYVLCWFTNHIWAGSDCCVGPGHWSRTGGRRRHSLAISSLLCAQNVRERCWWLMQLFYNDSCFECFRVALGWPYVSTILVSMPSDQIEYFPIHVGNSETPQLYVEWKLIQPK